jgi:hypothetical protein
MTIVRPERLGEIEQAAAAANAGNEFEGEIREFVRKDVAVARRSKGELVTNDVVGENLSGLIDRVSAASVAEIDRLISELQTVRDNLRNEAERVQREITGFAGMSQQAMTSMKIIADSLAHWKAPVGTVTKAS